MRAAPLGLATPAATLAPGGVLDPKPPSVMHAPLGSRTQNEPREACSDPVPFDRARPLLAELRSVLVTAAKTSSSPLPATLGSAEGPGVAVETRRCLIWS